MSLYDWDGDGKKTFADDFIEYQIYKDVMGEKEEKGNFSFNSNKKNYNKTVENPQFITTVFSDDSQRDYSDPPSSGVTIISSLIVCILCFGGIALSVKAGGGIAAMLILFIAVALSILVFKACGVMR